MEIKNKDVSIVWPLSLIGFMIAFLCFVLICFIAPLYVDNVMESKAIYTATMICAFLSIVFAGYNIIFGLFTIGTFWDKLSFYKISMYFISIIIFNLFSCYFIARLWSKHSDIPIYSIKGKRKLEFIDPLIITFSFFSFFAFVLPFLMADTVAG
jgi:hypothetical protein